MATPLVKAAYWPSCDNEEFPPSSIDTSLFTHIFYAYVPLDAVTFELDVSDASSSLMSDFVTTLHQNSASTKALLSIGGANDEALTVFSIMASSHISRNTFIESTIKVAREFNFDGLDLNWISPRNMAEMRNLGLLLDEWHVAIRNVVLAPGKSPLLLTAAVYYSAEIIWEAPHLNSAASINQNLDWINVICYNYYGPCDTLKTGAHASLYNTGPDIHKYKLKSWIDAGVSVKKLVMGFALYGRTWNLGNWKISRHSSTIWENSYRAQELQAKPLLWLYKAALNGDREKVIHMLQNNDLNVPVSMFRENVLHVIASKGDGTELLNELVNQPNLNTNLLLEKDVGGNTALFLAAMSGNRKEAEILVRKNPALLIIPDSEGTFPVHVAAMYGHRETVAYLIKAAMESHWRNDIFESENWVYLLNLLITAGFYDMAMSLLDTFPALAYGKDIHNTTPLQTLAKLAHNLWQRDAFGKPFQLMSRVCGATLTYAIDQPMPVSDFFWDPLLTATKLGNHEIVEEIIATCPYIVWFTDDMERTIYHYAVLNRHEKVFNLIWNLGSNRYRIANMKGTDKNNILHLAAKLGVNTKSRVSGAALQMQRELQWYKEVEKLVPLSFQEEKGNDEMTPREMFTEEHKDLLKQGEDWMKTTATTSTLVAALIVIVVFAAALTMPGGNDSSKGVTIFLHKLSFKVFAISNAIALISSSTSLMMFFGILNSRYSEIDFLHSLPTKLLIGLCTLFLSILCMLIAFSTALHTYLIHLSGFIIIPIVFICPWFPLIIFGFLQFPLLIEIFSSTYGRSIFRQ